MNEDSIGSELKIGLFNIEHIIDHIATRPANARARLTSGA
jgi:hypothetical protein